MNMALLRLLVHPSLSLQRFAYVFAWAKMEDPFVLFRNRRRHHLMGSAKYRR